MEKILIIGGNGFVGKNLARKLSKYKYQPIIASRTPCSSCEYEHVGFDIFNYSSWKDLPRLDRVVNLAWYTVHPKFWDDKENINYMKAHVDLFEYLADRGFRHAVVSGTCAEYLCNKDSPSSNLGRSKLDCFNYLQRISESSSLKLNWARLFFVYGKGEPQTKLFTQIRKNQIELENIREPNAIRDFVHIDFVTDQIKFIIDHQIADTNDIGTGYGLQVKNLFYNKTINTSELNKYQGRPTKSRIIANTNWMKSYGIELDPEQVILKMQEFFN
jgi:nucleoside-diphosphate-sugar epimerase